MQKSLLLLMIPFLLIAREWTALVYMAADNSLAPLADSDLVEMQVVGSTDDVAIVVVRAGCSSVAVPLTCCKTSVLSTCVIGRHSLNSSDGEY